MVKEIWKKLPYKHFSDVYEVSNKGAIRSIAREVTVYPKDGKNYKKKLKSRLVAFRTNGNSPHQFTSISINDGMEKISMSVYPHKAVALAFIPGVDVKNLVSHVSEDYTDNSVENLFWSSKSDVSKRNMKKYPEMVKKLVNGRHEWLKNKANDIK